MRNRALHDALRAFALEAAALLLEDQRAGAELEFDVDEEPRRRGAVLYRYRPLTERFIRERWDRLPALPPRQHLTRAGGGRASARGWGGGGARGGGGGGSFFFPGGGGPPAGSRP